MPHEIHQVVAFEKVAPYTLSVTFEDDSSQVIDFRPVLRGEFYGPLRDDSLFDQVQVDPEVHTLVWPNGADFDPAMLYHWSELGSQLEALAESWPTTVEQATNTL